MLLLILSLLVALHLAAVSIGAIAPIFAVWLDWRTHRRQDADADPLGQTIALRSLQFLALGSMLGLLQLLLVATESNAAYRKAFAAIETSRWWFAVVELLFSFLCLAVYWGTWNSWRRFRFFHAALALLASSNLLYHFPLLFVSVGVVSERPDLWSSQIDMKDMLFDPDVVTRVGHFLLAALSVASIYVMGLASTHSATLKYAARLGQIALAAMFLQLPLGLMVLMYLPDPLREQLLGRDLLATTCLGLGITLSIFLLHNLAAAAFGDCQRSVIARSGALVFLVLLLMIAARCRMRSGISATDVSQFLTPLPSTLAYAGNTDHREKR